MPRYVEEYTLTHTHTYEIICVCECGFVTAVEFWVGVYVVVML